jgi:Cu(I)/Ag(I) efflux system membrane fusion protein
MRSVYIVLAFGIVCSTACNNSDNSAKSSTTATAPAAKAAPKSKLSDDGTTRLMNVVSKYYGLKNALVATKEDQTNAAATQLATEADSFSSFVQSDPANKAALKPYLDTIITQSRLITTIKDESCEKQRIAFETVSSAIYNMLKNVDLKNGGVYHQYCPMAFNDKGAFWISDESEIKNPYFGKQMLECGETTDSL